MPLSDQHPKRKKKRMAKNKKTIVVQIGNSDDKLTQEEWSLFVKSLKDVSQTYGDVHFSGGSATDAPWQNYCVVFEVIDMDEVLEAIRGRLMFLAKKFRQESIAMTEGVTHFCEAS